ncbi:thioredoxin-dependent thiol peroxidase [Rhizosphaericola mali]|uniref:thioredoxin-dependent peroxiredoxin n=1 Tax=Rhizosphaericola mali TaxID=2545455 RepID=A0A5P2G2F7_9BACT|nr:thioredoxin-dependent thiol peroxidase [Rhizosphaericola mali]QES88000.1 thioredoxin-dependent thiol peroxidase [Rhizosphaericola mali]
MLNGLKVGDKAPIFEGLDQNGKKISLKDYKGKKVVLYFYPKDNTPGCTAEACNLRDNNTLLAEKGYQVVGVSIDSVESHKKFETKFELPFPLIADIDKKIVEQYGVWGEKKFMGRTFDGTHRTTFLIDEKGIIAHIIDKPKTKDHYNQIIETWEK